MLRVPHFGHWPMLRADRALRAALLGTALIGALFLVLDGHTRAQVRAFWIGQLPLDLMLAWSSWRVFKLATGAIRRFWGVLGATGTLFLCGDAVQAALTVVGHGGWSINGGVVQTSCFSVGTVVILVAMLVHPHPSRSGRERLAFWLDSATVLVGGAVVAWCFAVTPERSGRPDMLATLVAVAVAITSGFAAVKILLSGNAPMHKAAAFPMIASAGATTVGMFLAPATTGSPAAVDYLIRFAPSLLIALGPRIQELIARFDPQGFGERRRKPYSLLPYGSIAVAFGMLLVVMPHGVDARMWGVVVGLGLICMLVAGRQLTSFHDNTALIKRLDATLAELREHEARLRLQAQSDGLTGLANRTHFHDEVRAALEADAPDGIAVLLVDLDGFKTVNDTMGHAAGDALLAGVAERLRAATRAGDLVARPGGDEFAVLLRGCAEPEAERTADRILEAFAVPVDIDGTPVCANASIGVAYAEPPEEVGALLRRADMAMYEVKSDGKGRWRRYRPEMEAGDASIGAR